jgi:protein-S-isoprenylcysteine O-methyltransferase Ste14
MALSGEFERAGNLLYRWRRQVPLLMIVICIVDLGFLEYRGEREKIDEPWELFFLAISFVGLGIRIFTIGLTPKGTSGRTTTAQIADTLHTNGIYSLVRNPLY